MILFSTLETFNIEGGIQKFNRCMLLALQHLRSQLSDYMGIGVYDNNILPNYASPKSYRCFNGNKVLYLWYMISHARRFNMYIWGHIHFAPIYLLVRFLHPRAKHILITHGIEVWGVQSKLQRYFLKKANQIWAVSQFTKDQISNQGIETLRRCFIFPNTLDPTIYNEESRNRPRMHTFSWENDTTNKKVLSLTRINHYEGYKGYDHILGAMNKTKNTKWVYILAGKSTSQEQKRLKQLAAQHRVQDRFIMPGHIDDAFLQDLYLSVDVFALPSKKEGFGIVFIEALHYGLPVIAGNKDGSADALLHGALGTLVNPDDILQIADALDESIQSVPLSDERKNEIYKTVHLNFGFERFKSRIVQYVNLL